MNRRFAVVSIVALAVLFCQSGGVVLAAICPHLRAQHETCHAMTQEMTVAHHESERAPGKAFETIDGGAVCNHCAVYARNKRDDSALEQPNASQRTSDLSASLQLTTDNPPALLKSVTWIAKAHGPPRD